ncbi:MAG: Gx transporter family protein [Eubacteriales bacterium]
MTLFAIYFIGYKEAAKIHILRIVLGSIFTGQTISFMYSISGGICCLLVMMLCRKLISKDFIWLAGIFSAIAHIVYAGRGPCWCWGNCQYFVLCTNCVSQQYCNRIFYWIMCSIFIEKA